MEVVNPITITDAILVSSNVPETDHALHSMVDTYALGNFVMIIGPDTHLVYKSLQDANTGHNPLEEPEDLETAVWWLLIGSTNQRACFDAYNASQTIYPELVNYVFQAEGVINSVALLNVSAYEVRIKMTDADFGLVYDKSFSLTYVDGIVDEYAWFFDDIDEVDKFAVTNLPNYANTIIEVSITRPAGMVKIGSLMIGKGREAGLTKTNASVALIDFSYKERNTRFGTTKLTPGDYTYDMDLQMNIPTDQVSLTLTYMATLRGKAALFIGTIDHNCTFVYGWFEKVEKLISYDDYSVFNTNIKGLI